MKMSSAAIQQMALQLADIERRLNDRTPQLINSSLDNGSLIERDEDGNDVSIIGKQPDDTHGVTVIGGPPPPRPSQPTATGGPGILTYGWDGVFANAVTGVADEKIVIPLDFTRVEAHASRQRGFQAETTETLLDTIESPRGGNKVAQLDGGTWYIVLVARSASGKRSLQSLAREVVVDPIPDVAQLREDFERETEKLGTDLANNIAVQEGLKTELGTLRDETLPALEVDLGAAQDRLDAADTLLKDTFPKLIEDTQNSIFDLAARGGQLIKNGDFELGDLHWQKNGGGTIIVAAAANGSKFGMRITPLNGNAWPLADRIPTKTGRVYRMEMLVRRTGADTWSTQSIGFVAQTRNAAGVYATPVVRAKLDSTDAEVVTGDIPTDSFVRVYAEVTIAQAGAVDVGFAPWFFKSADNSYDVDDFVVFDATLAAQATQKAIAAAAIDAQTKATAAKNAAVTAAALEADKKVATAKQATLEAAATDAQTKATAAKTAAEEAAALAAQLMANGAKSDAIAAAQTDATNKANAAKTAAQEAAALDATAKANKARTDAITAAASDATGKANAAQAAAISAAATDATNKANEAERLAKIDSAAAKTAADNAASDAAAAAGIANSKAVVLFQSAAPAAEYRNARTLWIDTTNNANTPKRWSTGTTWIAQTDKAATDAATAAANAKTAADNAAAAAGTAQNAADGAMTMAGSLNQVYYSTANPTGIAPLNSTWRKWDTSKNIIGEWRYVGGTVPWQAQLVSSEAISNLDVGKLTAGSGTFTDVIAEKMAVATASFQKVDIKNLFVTGTANLTTLTAQRIAANVATFLELRTDQLTATTANFQDGVAEKFAAATAGFMKLNANQVYIGEAGNIFPADLNDDAWQAVSGMTKDLTGGKNGTPSLMLPASTSQIGSYFALTNAHRGRAPRLVPGMTYNIKVNVRSDKVIPVAAARVYVRLYRASDPAAAYAWTSPSAVDNEKSVPALTWGVVEGKITVPEDTMNTVAIPGLYSQATALGAIRFSDLTITPVITPSLIVDGFFQGLRVIGASIETSSAANTGIKLSDNGLICYGVATDYDPVGKVNYLYNTRAIIDTRSPAWKVGASDTVAGLWFEATRQLSSAPATPFTPSGVVATNAQGTGVMLQSSLQANALDYRTSVSADQLSAGMFSESNKTSTTAVPARRGSSSVGPGEFRSQTWSGTVLQAEVASSAGKLGWLQLFGRLGVEVNGNTLVVEDTGWQNAIVQGTWQHRSSFGWAGVKWRAYNGVFTIMGSVTKPTAWITGENMVTVPDKYLAQFRVMGTNAYFDLATKTIQPENPGAANAGLNFSVSWPYI